MIRTFTSQQHVASQQPVMNAIAWIITLAGVVSLIACVAGIAYVITRPQARLLYTDSNLHDTYYVMTTKKTMALPLLLAASLSVAIAITGYSRTDYFLRQRFAPLMKPAEKI
jgi:hypothetical protein